MNRQQLADAMLKGLKIPSVKESRGTYIRVSDRLTGTTCFACALGCALIGRFNGDYKKAEKVYDKQFLQGEDGEYDIFGDLLEISPWLAVEIEHRHLNGHSIEDIAAWLKDDSPVMTWPEGTEANDV